LLESFQNGRRCSNAAAREPVERPDKETVKPALVGGSQGLLKRRPLVRAFRAAHPVRVDLEDLVPQHDPAQATNSCVWLSVDCGQVEPVA